MTLHSWADYRTTIIDRLTGLPTTQDRVYKSLARVLSGKLTSFPALAVALRDQEIGESLEKEMGLERKMGVVVSIVAYQQSEIDTSAVEIERAFESAPLGRVTMLDSWEFEEADESQKFVLTATSLWTIIYDTPWNQPEKTLQPAT